METTDITVEILKGIRDELRDGLRGVRQDLDKTNARLDETIVRLDRLERRQIESEMRIATQLVAVVGAVHEVRDALCEELGVRRQVEDHERRLRALESRER
jgi:hypothetical protein